VPGASPGATRNDWLSPRGAMLDGMKPSASRIRCIRQDMKTGTSAQLCKRKNGDACNNRAVFK
jgi:hypothetical protein